MLRYDIFILQCVIRLTISQIRAADDNILGDRMDVNVQPKSWDRKAVRPVDHIYLDSIWKLQSFPGLHIPIQLAPHPTFGMVLPLPSFWTATQRFHPVDVDNLEFKVIGANNYIMENAVNRYRKLISSRTGLSPYPLHWSHQESRLPHLMDLDPSISATGTAGAAPHLAEHPSKPWDPALGEQVSQRFEHRMHGSHTNSKLSRVLIQIKGTGSSWPSLNMDESYILSVDKRTIFLVANETWGALRGLESLSQLLWRTRDKAQVFINQTYIFDKPRFAHRGLLVDTSRHFISKAILLINLEAMAHHKMNVFHWHLIDDNSYPYESKLYPELSRKGSFGPNQIYTRDDIREIVEFARMRGIRVIPEFDIPGHTRSLAYSKPDLLAQCYDSFDRTVHFGPLNVYRNSTYLFLRDLFREAMELFPDEFMHLGGDEVDPLCWNFDDEMASQRQKAGLSDVSADEYFWRSVQNIFATMAAQNPERKRRLIVWEEVFGSVTELQKSMVMQIWKSGSSLNMAIANQILHSACWYLDNLWDPRHWGSYYLCDPVETLGLIEGAKPVVLGGEACMWAEFQSDDTILTKIWPVTSGVAERLWSPASVNSLSTLGPRLEEHRCRMISRGFPQAVILGPSSCELLGALNIPVNIEHALLSSEDLTFTKDTSMHSLILFSAGVFLGATIAMICTSHQQLVSVYMSSALKVLSSRRGFRSSTVLLGVLFILCVFIWLAMHASNEA